MMDETETGNALSLGNFTSAINARSARDIRRDDSFLIGWPLAVGLPSCCWAVEVGVLFSGWATGFSAATTPPSVAAASFSPASAI
eukprot:scaffold109622_cov34-Prasinocladus_malaysianus.AAC.1